MTHRSHFWYNENRKINNIRFNNRPKAPRWPPKDPPAGQEEERLKDMFGLFGYAFPAIFTVMFVTIFGIFIVQVIKGAADWHRNNQSPRLSVGATIVAKRQNTTHHTHPNAGDVSGAHGYHTTSSTRYYVTFQVESGDRMELSVPGREYGMLAEGDAGKLTFQGTRYLSFDRV